MSGSCARWPPGEVIPECHVYLLCILLYIHCCIYTVLWLHGICVGLTLCCVIVIALFNAIFQAKKDADGADEEKKGKILQYRAYHDNREDRVTNIPVI